MNDFLNTVASLGMHPLLWIGATVLFLICAALIGEVFPNKQWREFAIWVPIGLLAALAMRPYPKGPEQPHAAPATVRQMPVVPTLPASHIPRSHFVSVVTDYVMLDGKYHLPTCERLHGRAAEAAIPRSMATLDADHSCPDCRPHER